MTENTKSVAYVISQISLDSKADQEHLDALGSSTERGYEIASKEGYLTPDASEATAEIDSIEVFSESDPDALRFFCKFTSSHGGMDRIEKFLLETSGRVAPSWAIKQVMATFYGEGESEGEIHSNGVIYPDQGIECTNPQLSDISDLDFHFAKKFMTVHSVV